MPDDSTVDLNFLAQQNRRILDEMAELRGDMASFRDDLHVLTAMVIRLENSVGRVEQRIDRFAHRVTALETLQQ